MKTIVDRFYRLIDRQKQTVIQKCGCGLKMSRVEFEEYGKCWMCRMEEKEEGEAVNA